MMQAIYNTYKQNTAQTLDNAWKYDNAICKDRLQNDMEG